MLGPDGEPPFLMLIRMKQEQKEERERDLIRRGYAPAAKPARAVPENTTPRSEAPDIIEKLAAHEASAALDVQKPKGWPVAEAPLKPATKVEKPETHEEAGTPHKPGSMVDFLMDIALPADLAEDAAITLTELYEDRWLPKHGEGRARTILAVHVVATIASHWKSGILRLLELIMKWWLGK